MSKNFYEIYIDTGGTFTDVLAFDMQNRMVRLKILSKGSLRGKIISRQAERTYLIEENWHLEKDILQGFAFNLLSEAEKIYRVLAFDPRRKLLTLDQSLESDDSLLNFPFEISSGEDAPVLATRVITQTPVDEEFPPVKMRLGTTKGTNALLESKGAKSVLFTTKGFGDLLKIGTQQRPDIFSLDIPPRQVLPRRIIEIEERIAADGTVLTKLNPNNYKKIIQQLKAEGYTSAAVAFLHSWTNQKHEIHFRQLLEESGFQYISISSALSPLIKLLERTQTTTVNAYLNPVIKRYLAGIMKHTGQELLVMNSAGGLVTADQFYPKDSLLSGPAGGVVGAVNVGKQCGHEKLITFDMGGTSTDVSLYSGQFDYQYEVTFGNARVFSPAIAIETVAAGGGSICAFDGFKMTVGPESAGAYPGPACYGAGGPLTLTDINLLSGRLDIRSFGIPVDMEAADKRLGELMEQMEMKTGERPKKEKILAGFLSIANEIMAGAIRKISVSKGFNPADYALLAFGGAGGLHACAIAGILGMGQIIVPADAGILSAAGIGQARVEKRSEKQLLLDFETVKEEIDHYFEKLSRQLFSSVQTDEFEISQRKLFLRFKGQDSSLAVDWMGDSQVTLQSFREEYEKLFGHWIENCPIEIESIRVSIQSKEKYRNEKSGSQLVKSKAKVHHFQNGHTGSAGWEDMPVYLKTDLQAGNYFTGPALVTDDKSTTFLEKQWQAKVDRFGNLILKKGVRQTETTQEKQFETQLELFTNRFKMLAENMGAVLQRTALSVNIKERMDFSCALLDNKGYLVANAPHIPVHLGGLGICVREILKDFTFSPGDTIITNHPAYGGSHLPDVTLITPVFNKKGKLLAFVVNRAHHAEIGGIAPGSMPPSATRLSEEGVVIAPTYLVKQGKVLWQEMEHLFSSGKYPSRSVSENMADLKAALVANINGQNAFLQMLSDYGEEEVLKYMEALREMAANKMRHVLSGFPDGEYKAEEKLDDGSLIRTTIIIRGDKIHFDFSGSSPVHSGNMNANLAIVNSVIIYVMRLLLNEDIPLNDGLMKPVSIHLPTGLLNPVFSDNPDECPAVVGGNVEISQRLTDTLLKAFGIAACSQGTMNNVLFGNRQFGYYETVAGGVGATRNSDGASGVHQHMTNTRITDPEILEHRYPIRLKRFAIRQGSGGKGKHKGGDGLIREYEFLDDMELSILSQHRKSAPYGMNGGEQGKTGDQWLITASGVKRHLDGITQLKVHKNDIFLLKTPGGGGFG
jgi:5-oxoprolinase (ATP-hydrolysing)